MASADFWQYAVIVLGAASTLLYLFLVWQGRGSIEPAGKVLGLLIAAICAYPTVLWGGQAAGLWKITAEYGRPALATALAAVLMLGILAFGQRPRP